MGDFMTITKETHDRTEPPSFDELPVALARLKLLSNAERLKILCVLGEQTLNVGQIEQMTGVAQPTLSQQLTVLRKSGVVATEKQGKYIYYQLADEKIVTLIHTLHALYCKP